MQSIKDKLTMLLLEHTKEFIPKKLAAMANDEEEVNRVHIEVNIEFGDEFAQNQDTDNEVKDERKFDEKLQSSLISINSSNTVISNYEEFLNADYKLFIKNLALNSVYQRRIKFEVRDSFMIARLSGLHNSLIGDIELEMDVPDETAVNISFNDENNNEVLFALDTINITFKDKKAVSDKRIVDFTSIKPDRLEVDAAVCEILEELEGSFDNEYANHIISRIKYHYDESRYAGRHTLEIKIRNAYALDLNCNMYARFKCGNRYLQDEELKLIHELYGNFSNNGLKKEHLKNIESLY